MESVPHEASIEEINPVTKRVKVKIEAPQFKAEFERQIAKYASTASIKGFRPGKAPKQMIEKQFGPRIQSQLVDDLVSSSLSEVAADKSLDVISVSDLEVAKQGLSDGLEFAATLFLYPKPEITSYEGVSVKVNRSKIGEDEIEKVIERLRDSKATLKPVEDRKNPKTGDVIHGELAVEVEGEESSRPEPLTIEVGCKEIPTELNDAILKTSVGESSTAEAVISEDHKEVKLRGKKAKYTIQLTSISEKELPVVDDEFAKSASLGVESLAQLREKIQTSLEEEVNKTSKADAEVELLKKLIELNPFDIPQVMVDDEIRNLAVRAGIVDPNKIDIRRLPIDHLRKGLEEVAIQRVKGSLIVDRIAEIVKLESTDADVDAKIVSMAEEIGLPEQEVRKFMLQDGRTNGIKREITRTKVMDFLMSKSTIDYVEEIVAEESGEKELAEKETEEKGKGKKGTKKK